MNDISNKTLAVLVGVAIVVSLFGLFMERGKITGMATVENETGEVQLTVGIDVNILANDDVINFGTMTQTKYNSSELIMDNITVGNIGGTAVDIDTWANQSLFDRKNDSAGSPGTTLTQNEPDNGFQGRVMAEDCSGANHHASYYYINITLHNATDIVADCQAGENFTYGVKIQVPQWEPEGDKRSTLYFRATQA